jgi:hypothetical protein
MRILVAVLLAASVLTLEHTSALSWECDVEVSGPKTIKLDQQVTLSASGTPAGGSYSWSRTPNLIPSGSTATLTGFTPTYSDYIKVIGYYTSPKGKKCSDTIWLWACVCNLESIIGPDKAMVGEQVALSTSASPEGGAYTWVIETGTGSLTSSGSSAIFTGDKAGAVEIKASYIPPEGGEPCTKYHRVFVEDECKVTLKGDMYQRPVCWPVHFDAQGEPGQGQCSWNPSADFNQNGCSATYTGTTAGYDTVIAIYTTPTGSICSDSKSILSYSLDMLSPIPTCFSSGTTLQLSDFNLFTTPASGSFRGNVSLSPQVVSTNSQEEQLIVEGSLFCPDDSNTQTTVVTVINKDIKTTAGIRLQIPNLLTEPLEAFGLAKDIKFELQNSYSTFKQCCSDGPDEGTDGETAVRVVADLSKRTLIGFPLPKAARKYVTLDLLAVKLSGRGDIKVRGNAAPCQETQSWSGGGSVSVRVEFNTEAKAASPKYLLLEGKAGGRTDIVQDLAINSTKLNVTGKWGGITVAGKIKVQVFGFDAPEFFISHTYFPGKVTPPYSIDLPSLK